MTQQPEIRFRCDRCFHDINVLTNDQPPMARGAPPEGWVTLWINNSTMPASHLCPTCGAFFFDFMKTPK